MPRVAPLLGLRVRPRLRDIRQDYRRTLMEMSEISGVSVSMLSQLERGGTFPRPQDLRGLERAYGDRHGWYEVVLEVIS